VGCQQTGELATRSIARLHCPHNRKYLDEQKRNRPGETKYESSSLLGPDYANGTAGS